jgi:arsenate reductase
MLIDDTNKVKTFFENSGQEVSLTNDRKDLISNIALKIYELSDKNKNDIFLNFICTHNSRRSQLSQVWGYFAAAYFNFQNIKTYSGGTAVTAFFRNAVKTLEEVGFKFNVIEFNHQNPKYAISFNNSVEPLLGFSKLYNDSINSNPYIAITTCNSADENCPFIPEALWRFHLPFNDPKEYDNTEFEKEAYLKANKQIAGEIYYLFNEIKKLENN